MQSGFIPDIETLKQELEKQNIIAVFRQNETMVYGVTFIDKTHKTVFKGSDVDKNYSAKRLLERIGSKGLLAQKEQAQNKIFAEKLIRETDHSKGISNSLASLYAQGLRINTTINDDGNNGFMLGSRVTDEFNYIAADKKINAWLQNNDITSSVIKLLNREIEDCKINEYPDSRTLINHLAGLINDILKVEAPERTLTIGHNPKRKKKRKPNW